MMTDTTGSPIRPWCPESTLEPVRARGLSRRSPHRGMGDLQHLLGRLSGSVPKPPSRHPHRGGHGGARGRHLVP